MTHLRIEQPTGAIEEVSMALISKLYELVYAGLDASSNLQGRLHTVVSYKSEEQYLTSHFPDLFITSDDYAIPFEDSNMVTYLNSIGVGGNGYVTENDATNATIVANSANTTVTKFNELRYFTNITSSKNGWTAGNSGNIRFYEWTSLEEVDISNFVSLGHNSQIAYEDTFSNCTSLKKVIASDKLTKIGHRAFRNCSNLEQITGLSGEIEVFGTAFNSCTKLGDVNFSNVQIYFNTNKSGDGGAFGNCTSLTTLLLSTNTTYLPGSIFSGCSNLTTVSGLSNVTTISSEVFKNCSKLTTIDIDWTKITSISGSAFHTCTLLPIAELNCPSLTTLGGNVFMNCALLQTITNLGNSITAINDETFRGCTSLTSVVLPTTCTSLGNRVFHGCTNLTIISDLRKIITIGLETFKNCSSLTEICMPGVTLGEVSSVLAGIFLGCTSLQKVVLGDCVNIGNDWSGLDATRPFFKDCTSLTTIDIRSLQTINVNNLCTIRNCPNITSFILRCSTIPTMLNNETTMTMYPFGGSNVTLYVPDSSVNDYKTAWPDISSNIQSLKEYTGGMDFHNETFSNGQYQNHKFSAVEIINTTDTRTTLPASLFKGCTSLSSVALDGLFTSGNETFSGCTSLTSIDLSNTKIGGDLTFYNCSALTSIGVTNMSDLFTNNIVKTSTFSGCTLLLGPFDFTEITQVNGSAFFNSGLSGVLNLPNIVTIGNSNAFGNTNITKAIIGDSITSIGNSCFNNCASLTELTILATTPPTLGSDVFTGSAITSIKVPAGTLLTYQSASGWSNFANVMSEITI